MYTVHVFIRINIFHGKISVDDVNIIIYDYFIISKNRKVQNHVKLVTESWYFPKK